MTPPATTTARPPATATRCIGTVRWFSHKGFGFIDHHDGGEVYVHYSGIVGAGFRTLDDSAEVTFDVIATPRGPEAADVVVLDATTSRAHGAPGPWQARHQ